MANEIGGFGLKVQIIASTSFPSGFTLSQFADDGDPLDLGAIDISEQAMGLNGDMITWSKANPLPVSINIIPGSDDDKNLAVIAEANRVGRGKKSVRDVITMVVIYPDGTSTSLINGKMKNAMFGKSVASAGRMKTKKYDFMFENRVAT